MKLTSDIEDQIDAIRDQIYEKIKDLTPSEETAYFNKITEEAQKKYNFKIIKSVSEISRTGNNIVNI